MKLHINIHSYQRKEMLESLIKEIKTFQLSSNHTITYSIIDDGSDFILEDEIFYQFNHGGKEKFWKIFDYSFKLCKNIDADIYLFIPSDVSNIQFNKIFALGNIYKYVRNNSALEEAYCYNVTNDGRVNCWNMIKAKEYDEYSLQCWFSDCGFFCNRLLLEKLDFSIYEVNQNRFKANSIISSGVGQQITQRLNHYKIKTFLPKTSLCYHSGSHPSLMHPLERLKNPLKSK